MTSRTRAITDSITTRRQHVIELISEIVDPGSFVTWDDHCSALRHASIEAGEAKVAGHRLALIASNFEVAGGSLGEAEIDRIISTIRRATQERLPLLALPASGGVRLQDGVVPFVRLADVVSALVAHKAGGLAYVVYLRHPTTGGALATWGSLGQLTIAEPGALITLLGPRVVETLTGQSLPRDVTRAENLAVQGVIDSVLEPRAFAALLASFLRITSRIKVSSSEARQENSQKLPAVKLRRERAISEQPLIGVGIAELLEYAAEDVVRLRGTSTGERDDALVVALARLAGHECVVIGHDSEWQRKYGLPGPAAFRQAVRGLRIAEELGLPVVTVVDTFGTVLSAVAEEGALAGSVADSAAALAALTVPSVAVLLGEARGASALALIGTQRLVAVESAQVSPLPRGGAEAVLGAASLDAALDETSTRTLHQAGLVDVLFRSKPHRDSPESVASFARELAVAAIEQIQQQSA